MFLQSGAFSQNPAQLACWPVKPKQLDEIRGRPARRSGEAAGRGHAPPGRSLSGAPPALPPSSVNVLGNRTLGGAGAGRSGPGADPHPCRPRHCHRCRISARPQLSRRADLEEMAGNLMDNACTNGRGAGSRCAIAEGARVWFWRWKMTGPACRRRSAAGLASVEKDWTKPNRARDWARPSSAIFRKHGLCPGSPPELGGLKTRLTLPPSRGPKDRVNDSLDNVGAGSG